MKKSRSGAVVEPKNGASRIDNGGAGAESKKSNIEHESSSEREKLKKRIDSECEKYKRLLCSLMYKDYKGKSNSFIKCFKTDEDLKKCKEYYKKIISGISGDTFIDTYCRSDEASITTVKEDFGKSSRKKQIRNDTERPFQWPTYKEDYVNENKKKVRGKGNNFDIHHIIPKSLGGGNEASNTIPMHVADHYDKRVIHADDRPLNHLGNFLVLYKERGFCDGGCVVQSKGS